MNAAFILKGGRLFFKARPDPNQGAFSFATGALGAPREAVQHPGIRGGKYYLTRRGRVKYGDRPVSAPPAAPRPEPTPTMPTDTGMDAFAAALHARHDHLGAQYEQRTALQAGFDAAVVDAFVAKFPKKKLPHHGEGVDHVKLNAALGEEAVAAIRAPFQARADALKAAQKAQADADTATLDALAEKVTLVPTPGADSLYRATSGYYYSTQGYGANGYAKNDAELRADEARALGATARVVVIEKPPPAVRDHGPFSVPPFIDYEVRVNWTPEQVEAAHRKPGMPLREVVKRMWKRGINPRVSMPFLPPGYEDKVGIDYQGNDKARAVG